ncbi:hypothetical protein [Symmachiella dynata]|uniref:hypothetical protein n=1 Tax=Symmachiella dynata TaxID=2527995 RepID=UPI0030ED936D
MYRGHKKPFSLTDLEELKKDLLKTFLEQHQHLFVSVTENWFDPDMAIPPLASRYDEMLSWTKEWLFSNTCAGPLRILADNCRFTRGVAELLSSQDYGTTASNIAAAKSFIFSSVGPCGIIHVEAEAGAIVKRIKRREQETNGFRHPGHRNLSDRQLAAYSAKRNNVNSTAIAVFRDQGIPVITICGTTPLDENVKTAEVFLRDVVAGKVRAVSQPKNCEPIVSG